MRKKVLGILTLIVIMLGCIFGLVACGANTDDRDAKIVEVYNKYVVYAEEKGFTPLSYEEWINTIKGKDGANGQTPYIGGNGNWFIGETDTGVKAQGKNGENGIDGDDGETPYIGQNGNWWIGGTDTTVKAQGEDGETPYIGQNGNWWIGETDTTVKAQGQDGKDGKEGKEGKGIKTISFKDGVITVEYTDGTKSTFDVSNISAKVYENDVIFPSYIWNAPQYEYCTDLDFDETLSEAGVKGIFYTCVPYKGLFTKVAAYIGFPKDASKDNKVPAIVLVHGAGGTAMPDWVKYWNDLGYAAIAIDTEGAEPIKGVKRDNPAHNDRNRYENGKLDSNFTAGPYNHGMRDGDEKVEDQWMYHAVADTIAGASLLLADERVDGTKLGITGISYGSMITTETLNFDNRFAFAMPIYGGLTLDKSCSSFYNLYYTDMSDDYIAKYYKEMVARWDGVEGLKNSDCKVYYVTSTTDFAFSMDIASRCAEAAGGQCNFKVGYAHNNMDGSEESTISSFANYVTGKDGEFIEITQIPSVYNNTLKIKAHGGATVSAVKVFATDSEEPYTGDPNSKKPGVTAVWKEDSLNKKIDDETYLVQIPACKLYYIGVEYANGAKQVCSYLMKGSNSAVTLSTDYNVKDDFTKTVLANTNVYESNHVSNTAAAGQIEYQKCLQPVEVLCQNESPDNGYITYMIKPEEGEEFATLKIDFKCLYAHQSGAYWYNASRMQSGQNELGANIYVEYSYDNADWQRIYDLNEANGKWIESHNLDNSDCLIYPSIDLTSYAEGHEVLYVRLYIQHFTTEKTNIGAWSSGIPYNKIGAEIYYVDITGMYK